MSDSPDTRECPYVGLEPFEPTHAAYFFGRRFDSKVLADHVRVCPVTVLYGQSGVGKSSVINVGLPAALAADARWTIVRLSKWQNPDALERVAIDALIEALAPEERPRRREPRNLRFALLAAWAIRTTKRPLLLIFDQFEEYFLYRDRGQMREIETTVGVLSAKRNFPLHILFCLRDDGLYHLDELRTFIPGILTTTIELHHLDDEGVREAILGPIKRYNEDYRRGVVPITLDDAIVPTLIQQLKEVDNSPGAHGGSTAQRQFIELPYLQLALTKLWDAEGGASGTEIRKSTLMDRLGGVSRIVRDHVNIVMKELDEREQALCAKVFDRLVTAIGGKIAYPTKALATPEIVGSNVSEGTIDAILNKLTTKEARILKSIGTANGLQGYEIFHDVLGLPVLEWKRNFDGRAVHTRLRRVRILACALMVVIAGLIGWFNQKYFRTQWYSIFDVRPYLLTAETEPALKPQDLFKECVNCPVMVVVPAGNFMMGSQADEKGHHDDEAPQHKVVISQPFAVSEFEVTFDEWDACVAYGGCPNANDANWGRGRQPVINISWDDAQIYVAWLSKMTGKDYRLLSEAEWEYAARAGSDTAYFWGNDVKKDGTPMANCADCGSQWADKRAAPVGQFPDSQFALHDMNGNVWEWVQDCYVANYDGAPSDGSARRITDPCVLRVARGGAWGVDHEDVRSARRISLPQGFRLYSIGLRVGRTLAP